MGRLILGHRPLVKPITIRNRRAEILNAGHQKREAGVSARNYPAILETAALSTGRSPDVAVPTMCIAY